MTRSQPWVAACAAGFLSLAFTGIGHAPANGLPVSSTSLALAGVVASRQVVESGSPVAADTHVVAGSISSTGIKSYSIVSPYLGGMPAVVRVLEPTSPAVSMPRRLLFVLPVEAGLTTVASPFSDGLEELRQLDIPNLYNVTLVAPSFDIEPWYADHVSNPGRRLESYVVHDLVPFGDSLVPDVKRPLRWLIGFSKSGFGALALIFKHPDVFDAAAAWDAPVQLASIDDNLHMSPNFGTNENFALYRIPVLLTAHPEAFASTNRIWISTDESAWTAHMKRLDEQLTQVGIVHTTAHAGRRIHSWYSGWLAGAVADLAAHAPSQTPVP